MIKAIISNGAIVPRDPLPADWQEGTEVVVELFQNEADASSQKNTTDEWMAELEASARLGTPEDDARLEAAIENIRRREKEFARTQLGLEP